MIYLTAIGWGFLGWVTRVVWTYYTHSKEVEAKPRGHFKWHSFKEKYDQDWIMGFVAMVVLAIVSDLLWGAGLNKMILDETSDYDPRVNILIGFMSIYIIEKLGNKK